MDCTYCHECHKTFLGKFIIMFLLLLLKTRGGGVVPPPPQVKHNLPGDYNELIGATETSSAILTRPVISNLPLPKTFWKEEK